MYSIADTLLDTALRRPDAMALIDGERRIDYAHFASLVTRLATALIDMGLAPQDRVAVYMDKSVETVASLFAVCGAGLIVVPVNPKLKPQQVAHILGDCGAAVLITTPFRHSQLAAAFDLSATRVVLVSASERDANLPPPGVETWEQTLARPQGGSLHRSIDVDPCAILYTSGSTGTPKGVVVCHRNLVEGARSVNRYLGTTQDDTILSLLPLSFDAGLSQLTTGTAVGATVVLHNYLRAADAVAECVRTPITSITGVPPLWGQLAEESWPEAACRSVRLFATTGGHMPAALLGRLREIFPAARPFLMYGLTEAFRSTYLDPSEVQHRPGSIGKAIPNAEILVLREDGSRCAPGETGELVHRGALVTLGYWNDPERTTLRYRALPQRAGLLPEYAVWSGDYVKTDDDGFLYFCGRRDEMIKSSGYRISPTEVETVLFAAPEVREAAVIGLPLENGDQEVVALVVADTAPLDLERLRSHCRRLLPTYMVPRVLEVVFLPRSPNGKIDRAGLPAFYREQCAQQQSAEVLARAAESAATREVSQ